MTELTLNTVLSTLAQEIARELHRLSAAPAAAPAAPTPAVVTEEPQKRRGRPPKTQGAEPVESQVVEAEAPAPVVAPEPEPAPAPAPQAPVAPVTRDQLRPVLTAVASYGATNGRPSLLKDVLAEFGAKNAAEITDEMMPGLKTRCEAILAGVFP